MGCSSCQQNNHVVPSTHVHNQTSQTHCECACGCEEPVCPTPQPCTEITDSKCIIYTDAPIVCGNDMVVDSGSSVSIALNRMVDFFCAQQNLTIPNDLVCEDVVIVSAGSSLQTAIQLLSVFICEVASIPGPAGPQGIQGEVGPEGPQGEPGTNGTTAYKFVYEELSVLGGDFIDITRPQLEACGLVPTACLGNDSLVDEVCDLHVQVYYLDGGIWYKIPNLPYFSTDQGYDLKIIDATGTIRIQLNVTIVDTPVRVRVVVLA
jgi:hypothetical protein